MVPDDEFSALFENFRSSVFRLEALDHYWVEDDGRYQAFIEGRPRPEVTPGRDQWLKMIASGVANGKRWERVHVIDTLSSYVRFELESGYPELTASGERIGILEAQKHGGRDAWPQRDFWLFDDETVVWMDYDAEGRLSDRIKTTDNNTVQECIAQRAAMLTAAESYENFLRRYKAAHV